jgi:hypothetical protein
MEFILGETEVADAMTCAMKRITPTYYRRNIPIRPLPSAQISLVVKEGNAANVVIEDRSVARPFCEGDVQASKIVYGIIFRGTPRAWRDNIARVHLSLKRDKRMRPTPERALGKSSAPPWSTRKLDRSS